MRRGGTRAWRPVVAGSAGLVLAAGMTAGITAWAAGPAAALPAGCSQSGMTVTCVISYSGQQVTWDVPLGVTQAKVTLLGGSGGPGGTIGNIPGGAGGAGAEVTGTITLNGALTVNVGGVGGNGNDVKGTGGYNGGGEAGDNAGHGGGGGGATTVSDGSATQLEAGGGGGGAMQAEARAGRAGLAGTRTRPAVRAVR